MTLSAGTDGIPMLASLALKFSAPVVLIETMRLLPMSETQMLPSGATVTPHGILNAVCLPVPVGLLIGVPQTPVEETLCMRLLSVSATQIVPFGATEMPVGLLRLPAGAVVPVVPF